jgi:H+/Cl- antiporter ClcA
MRRKARRRRQAGLYGSGQIDWRQRIYEAYDAAQGWIVVTIIGAAIGLNAAFLSIITEWLADIKTGYCSSKFYLNEDFCCWGEENGSTWDCVRLARYVEGGTGELTTFQSARPGGDGRVLSRSTISFTLSLRSVHPSPFRAF